MKRGVVVGPQARQDYLSRHQRKTRNLGMGDPIIGF